MAEAVLEAETVRISPLSLSSFLGRQEPELNLSELTAYSGIFREIRNLPISRQEKLLALYLRTKSCSQAESLAKFLAEVNNPATFHQEIPASDLEKLSQEYFSRLGSAVLPVRIINEIKLAKKEAQRISWKELRGVINEVSRIAVFGKRREIRIAAMDMAHGAYWGMARELMGELSSKMAQRATEVVKQRASGIATEDLMAETRYKKGDPFEPLWGMLKTGYVPLGEVDGEFVIFNGSRE